MPFFFSVLARRLLWQTMKPFPRWPKGFKPARHATARKAVARKIRISRDSRESHLGTFITS
jgi:hypothetical protein